MAPIFVRTVRGTTINMDVDDSETIDVVKAKIHKMTGIFAKSLRVVFEEGNHWPRKFGAKNAVCTFASRFGPFW